MSRRVPGGSPYPGWPGEPEREPGYGQPGYDQPGYGADQGYGGQGYGRDAYGQDQYGQYRQNDQPGQYDQPDQYGRGYDDQPRYDRQPAYGGDPGYTARRYPGPGPGYGADQGYGPGNAWPPGDAGPPGPATPPWDDQRRYQGPGLGPGGPAPSQPTQNRQAQPDPARSGRSGRSGGSGGPGRPRGRKVRFRRTRRFFRHRVVQVISVVVALCLAVVLFSAGQAAFKSNGQGLAANLAEWARDHDLGPVVTFGEWLSYNPPKKGGKPSFSLTVPSGEAVSSPAATAKGKSGKKAFVPDIPATLKSLAGAPISGEGQWRVVEKVKGEPAILTTFLRDATYTSYVNGIASIDQRLVKFSLHSGTEDPGVGDWGESNTYIPQGQRAGLLATFNGGFKLDAAGGGFYLDGHYHGSLVNGAASVVYYKNGTVKIGEWGRDFTMNSKIAGVRQNLKLLVDHGKVATDASSDVVSNWGATLGGGYYVWRSGLGITKDGRIVYVYGPELDAQDLGQLLQRAGAVEGMQMDINPDWMKFDYYEAKGNPDDPTPETLLPNQQPAADSYYTPSTRDFTAVYAR